MLLAACAPNPATPSAPGESTKSVSTGPKRVTTAITASDPATLRSGLAGAGAIPGVDVLEDLVHAGLTRRDDTDTLRPVLAEALPTIDSGLWKILPDNRMQTSWTVKEGARWHDGTPFTAQDLAFTLTVSLDKEMTPFRANLGLDLIDGVTAPDDRTISVTWKQPFIEADALFTTQLAMPMPRHLLEPTYRENKRGLTDLPYWNREFVGAGPFQMRDWVDGSHITFAAFDGYVFGRPRLDEIVVRFIRDPNALVANMLAGQIDANLGRGMSLEQALQIRDQWPEGRMEVGWVNWVIAYPQFIDPRPAVLLDIRFRKALVHAMDRKEMADTLQAGLVPVADTYFNTSLSQFSTLDPFIVKYPYDPRLAIQMVESTGYARGPDGIFHDASGQRLSLEVRESGQQEIQTKAQLSMSDYWQRVGIGTEMVTIGAQRITDVAFVATRPAFQIGQNVDGNKGLRRVYSSETPLPDNNFLKAGNVSRYMNPEFDRLLDRYFSTIPLGDRMQALGQVLHYSTDQLTVIGLFYGTQPRVSNNRVVGIGARKAQEGTEAWNAHEWDLRS